MKWGHLQSYAWPLHTSYEELHLFQECGLLIIIFKIGTEAGFSRVKIASSGLPVEDRHNFIWEVLFPNHAAVLTNFRRVSWELFYTSN